MMTWPLPRFLRQFPSSFKSPLSKIGLLERCCTVTPMNQEHTVRYTANPNPCVQVRFLFIINYCFRVRLEPQQSREEETMNWDLASMYREHGRSCSSNQSESGTWTRLEGTASTSEHHTSKKGSDWGSGEVTKRQLSVRRNGRHNKLQCTTGQRIIQQLLNTASSDL